MTKLLVVHATQRVGKFLIQHKFFERDQRLTRAELMHQEPYFMTKFPEPPLERLPTVITRECRRGFIPCLKRVDELIGVKFSRKDLFMVRTAASYYMCWYTMLLEPMLAKFHSSCHIPYVLPDLAEDYKGFDSNVFDCAYHSFCPDPCCGHLNRTSKRPREHKMFVNQPYVRGTSRYRSECNSLPDYPCGFAAGSCKYDAKRNRNFRHLIANKFNLTCSCLQYRKGFVFDGHFKMCIDYDECRHKSYICEPQSVCRNLQSDYYCTCSLGYKFNYSLQICIKDENFEFLGVLRGAGIVDNQARRVSNSNEFFLKAWARWLISMVTSLLNLGA